MSKWLRRNSGFSWGASMTLDHSTRLVPQGGVREADGLGHPKARQDLRKDRVWVSTWTKQYDIGHNGRFSWAGEKEVPAGTGTKVIEDVLVSERFEASSHNNDRLVHAVDAIAFGGSEQGAGRLICAADCSNEFIVKPSRFFVDVHGLLEYLDECIPTLSDIRGTKRALAKTVEYTVLLQTACESRDVTAALATEIATHLVDVLSIYRGMATSERGLGRTSCLIFTGKTRVLDQITRSGPSFRDVPPSGAPSFMFEVMDGDCGKGLTHECRMMTGDHLSAEPGSKALWVNQWVAEVDPVTFAKALCCFLGGPLTPPET